MTILANGHKAPLFWTVCDNPMSLALRCAKGDSVPSYFPLSAAIGRFNARKDDGRFGSAKPTRSFYGFVERYVNRAGSIRVGDR